MHEDWGELDVGWRGVRSEVVGIAGTPVHVLRADATGHGPTQLLVHGLSGSATNWLEVMVGLAEHGPVIAPDLPGFGRTPPPSSGSSRLVANLGFLRRLASELGIERATVHGNSMGGLLTTQLAAAEPSLVERLVLVDPAFPAPRRQLAKLTPATWKTFAPFVVPSLGRRLVGRRYANRTADELFEASQSYVHGDPTRVRAPVQAIGRENIAFGQETPWRLDGLVGAAESLVAALVGGRGILRTIDAVEAPTLLLWGSADQLIGRGVIDAAVARRPDWELHVFEGVGHVPMLEVPADYLATVKDWYERQGSGSWGSGMRVDRAEP